MTITRHPIRTATALAVIATAALLALPASAGLFRCELADGRTVYTDNAALCPGAKEHQPVGAVQSVTNTPSARPAAPRRSSTAALQEAADAGAEARWRQKKASSETELQRLEKRREYLNRYVSHCNRGGDLFGRDAAGLKHGIPCSQVLGEFDGIDAKIASLRAYLDEGLRDECRRAGCLPGWLR